MSSPMQPTIITTGSADVGALAIGQTKPVTVTLKRSFNGTDYTAQAWLSGTVVLLGQIEIVGDAVPAGPNTVTVNVKNIALVALNSGKVRVVAEKN